MDRLPVTRAALDESTARALRRQRAAGGLVRVGHGMTVAAEAFHAATDVVRHRARIESVVTRSRTGLIVSHQSAVALHGLPWFGPFPDRVVLTDPSRDRAQRLRFSDKVPARGRLVRTVLIDGIETTDLVTTAVDVALRCDRGHAIVVIDAVLARGVPRQELLAELAARSTQRGRRRAKVLIELADARIESPGESLTHLVMHDVGLSVPVLQHEFRTGGKLIARVDFWFPDEGVVVEFDGLAKYRDPALRAGRTADEVVVAEKRREDDVRSLPHVRRVVRVTWRDVNPGGAAPRMFSRAGLPVAASVERTPSW